MRSAVKRAFDVVVAGASLVLAAPLFATVAVSIRLESPGPVLFKQTRVGRQRKAIQTMKFRTMVPDAEQRGLQLTAGDDPRVTRVGRFLRRSKLDELPQLWNIVRGDMSLVGPRPEVPRYVAMYEPAWQKVLDVRPGLTDLASLVFRDEERLLALAIDHERAYREIIMPHKLALAVEGVERSSLMFDVGIIVRTVLAVATRSTTYRPSIIEAVRAGIARQNSEQCP